MKNKIRFYTLILFSSLIISSCGKEKVVKQPEVVIDIREGQHQETVENSPKIDYSKIYSIKEASSLNLVKVSGNGLGTFQEIRIHLENKTSHQLRISIPSGLYFQNPDESSQSLITAEENETITLSANARDEFNLTSYCTNVRLQVPSKNSGWEMSQNFNGGLDEVIAFYGEHKEGINRWLKKKNPEKFSSERDIQAFFQVIVWSHQGGSYGQILHMLSEDVFGKDKERAKNWLNEVKDDARELAELIRQGDKDKIKEWVKNKFKEHLPNREELKDKFNNIRDKVKSAKKEGKSRLESAISRWRERS